MEQVFYINTLFGKNKTRILDELKRKIFVPDTEDYRFQIHPFRTKFLNDTQVGNNDPVALDTFKSLIKQHTEMLNDIKASNMVTHNRPFRNIIFVNYTTKELERGIEFGRVRLYLCDYVNETNIEIMTILNPVYINFFKKSPQKQNASLNSVFVNYSTLTFYDTDVERRVSNSTSLDLGEDTEDDETFVLRTQMRLAQISDNKTNVTKQSIFLPYHPFRQSLFASVQNAKNNINIATTAQNGSLVYYPFEQSEWLLILRNIMYERVFLNFLTSPALYAAEVVSVCPRLFRHSVSSNYRNFRKLQKRNKTQVLNVVVFNYKSAFVNNSNIYTNWYNIETTIANRNQASFATDILCMKSATGVFI